MKNRNELGKFLLQNGLNQKGVEVGSFKAGFAKEILESWPGKLYLVDVWRSLPKSEYDDSSNHSDHVNAYSEAMHNLSGFEDRAFMLRMKGEHAAELFRDDSLDFVYIDANHTYEEVKKDINIWYPKVKVGGILAGHDFLNLPGFNKENYAKGIKNLPVYMWDNNTPDKQFFAGIFGVNPAVEEFCEENGYTPELTQEWLGTWWVRRARFRGQPAHLYLDIP